MWDQVKTLMSASSGIIAEVRAEVSTLRLMNLDDILSYCRCREHLKALLIVAEDRVISLFLTRKLLKG